MDFLFLPNCTAQAMNEIGIFCQFQNPQFIGDVQKCEKMPAILHPNVHRQMLMVLFLLNSYDLKNLSKCRMPECRQKQSVTGISTSSQLPQSGIDIPASRSVRYYWSRISPTLSSYVICPTVDTQAAWHGQCACVLKFRLQVPPPKKKKYVRFQHNCNKDHIQKCKILYLVAYLLQFKS